jgi:hypothetical protein
MAHGTMAGVASAHMRACMQHREVDHRWGWSRSGRYMLAILSDAPYAWVHLSCSDLLAGARV